MSSKKGLMIAAPSSGSGKTTITLGLLRALKNAGLDVAAAKAGPDYIDPGFHQVSSGRVSVNLDPWAMDAARVIQLAQNQDGSHLIVEAMMGLYDGAADGSASAAMLAKTLGLPVILVVDAAKQSHSVAALVRGFRDHDEGVNICGVLLNRVGSSRHETMLRSALATIGIPVLGAIPRDVSLGLPERHLGLVQARETAGIEAFIENAAEVLTQCCDLECITDLFSKLTGVSDLSGNMPSGLKPLGNRIAIARDEAFTFCYPHLLRDWHEAGASISFFSPLHDEAPSEDIDAIYLPGGYPELHCARLSCAANFMTGMKKAAQMSVLIYGECGGYMVLGNGIADEDGKHHAMAGLLNLETSFEKRKLHLGYRKLQASNFPLGDTLKGHEFHYTTADREDGEALFTVQDAMGEKLGYAGLRDGNVMGSYMHVIDEVTR